MASESESHRLQMAAESGLRPTQAGMPGAGLIDFKIDSLLDSALWSTAMFSEVVADAGYGDSSTGKFAIHSFVIGIFLPSLA